jgi:hypothetical protein
MALTTEDKYKVIFALCYPGTVLDTDSVNFNSIIRDRLNIENSYVEDQARCLLGKIEMIKSKLEASPTKNNVKEIGDIVLDTGIGITLINKEYKRLLSELSMLLDIPSRCKTGRNISVCL